MPVISRTIRASAIPGLAAIAITACGSQSSASDGANAATPAKGAAASSAVLAQAAQAAPAVASQTALPITQGLYIADYSSSCASADVVFFYDGANYGYILQALPGDRMNSARPASAEIHHIQRAGASTRGGKDYDSNFNGFTRIWKAESVGNEVQGVKATGTGRFIWREGSLSARQMEYDDATYQKCVFPQLSPLMQAAVRQYRPQLASGAAPQASAGAQAPGTVASLPIEKGYWAVDMSCAQAIREADPYGLPDDIPFTYLDEKIDYLGALAIKRYEALGGNRYRLHGRASYGNGEPIEVPSRTDIIVNSRTSFTASSNDSMGSSTNRYTHCPTSQIPAAIRESFEG